MKFMKNFRPEINDNEAECGHELLFTSFRMHNPWTKLKKFRHSFLLLIKIIL